MNFFWVAAGRRAVSGGAPENRRAGKAGPAKLYSLHLIHLVPRRGNFLEIGSIVERGFAVGSSFPAAVDPKPLVRVGADGGFELRGFGELGFEFGDEAVHFGFEGFAIVFNVFGADVAAGG